MVKEHEGSVRLATEKYGKRAMTEYEQMIRMKQELFEVILFFREKIDLKNLNEKGTTGTFGEAGQ